MALPQSPLNPGTASESHDPLDPFSAQSLNRVGNPGMDINRPLSGAPEQVSTAPHTPEAPLQQPEYPAQPESAHQPDQQPVSNEPVQRTQEPTAATTAPGPVLGVADPTTSATTLTDEQLVALPPEQQVGYLVHFADQHGIAHAFAKCQKLGIDSPYLLDLLHDALVNAIRSHRANFHELQQ